MKFLSKDLQRCYTDFALVAKREKKDIVRMVARGFVKDMVAVTPPGSQGVTGSAAKKQGEAAIQNDLKHILVAVTESDAAVLSTRKNPTWVRSRQVTANGRTWLVDTDTICTNLAEIAAFHKSKRTKNGRVSKAGAKTRDIGRWKSHDRLIVPQALFEQYLKTVLVKVGFLASGWNAMAERLGVNLPAWVKRHGTRAGVVKVIEQGNSFRIEGINETAYVGNVKDYLRRIETVMGYQAEKLDRQTKAILKKAAKQVGFKG